MILRVGALKIGDIIHIKNLKVDCTLFAEGILLEDIAVHDALSSFEDALFCIHLQRQYSASLELQKCMKLHPDANCTDDVTISKYYHALQVSIICIIGMPKCNYNMMWHFPMPFIYREAGTMSTN